jgi:hypothetical protein
LNRSIILPTGVVHVLLVLQVMCVFHMGGRLIQEVKLAEDPVCRKRRRIAAIKPDGTAQSTSRTKKFSDCLRPAALCRRLNRLCGLVESFVGKSPECSNKVELLAKNGSPPQADDAALA